MLKIGEIELPDMPLILAPMEDISDPPFRLICKKMGADLVYTEFISSDGLVYNAEKSNVKLDIFDAERPVSIQVFGHKEESLVQAIKLIEEKNPDTIDLNFGCPVKKVIKNGAGAAALKEPEKMVRLTRAVVEATSLPVTVKTRLGWDQNSIIIPELSEKLQDTGIKALAVHARTAKQMYRGSADWSWFKKIKENPRFKIPLIGNGDVLTPEDAMNMKTNFRVDGIMIGRATMGNPWIFKEIKHFFKTGEKLSPPSISEKVDICKKHLLDSVKWKGEKLAILEMRKHYSHYFKSIKDIKNYRVKLTTNNSLNEILELLEIISVKYS